MHGGDLSKSLAKRVFSENEVSIIIWQLCLAIKFIHGQGLIHRDLKIENLLLEDSNGLIIKLSDFGLSHKIESSFTLNQFCGTPHYMAPEMVVQLGNGVFPDKEDTTQLPEIS